MNILLLSQLEVGFINASEKGNVMNKRFLKPVAFAVAALISASPAFASTPDVKQEILKISENLQKNASSDALVIEKAADSEMKFAQHYSHRSHSSHSSHYSHRSHYSSSY